MVVATKYSIVYLLVCFYLIEYLETPENVLEMNRRNGTLWSKVGRVEIGKEGIAYSS